MAGVARPQPRLQRPRRAAGIARLLLLAAVVAYLVLPLLSTVAFSLATVWNKTVLPEGYTLEWYRQSLSDPQILRGIQRSLLATVGALLIGLALVVPALLWVHLRAPRLKRWLEFLAIVPWALPGVVLALAIIRAYIGPYNVSRPLILVLVYTLVSLPFMFRAIDAALSAVDLRTLVEAAQTLGAGWPDTLRRVILPNITPGILSAALLVAALASGEYVLARLLGGTGWKTFALYQAEAQFTDGRVAAALAALGFAFTWLVSMGLILLSGRRAQPTPLANK
ncbi:MAG: ABC transporter permease subunit [Chloroflexia bacterium]|nr:ABC transporter permease subunit [Chloroflexia bacterium]